MFIKKNFLILSLLGGFAPFSAFAAGFQLYEHSAAGLGRAFAGEAIIADNASSISHNPATLTLFSHPSFSAGVIFVKPNVDVEGYSLLNKSNANASNIAPSETIPNLHVVYPINETWAIGGSLTSNYGLSTKFDENYTAGNLAGTTKLMTGNLNLSLAHRVHENVSIGLGLNAVYAKAKIIRHLGQMNPMMPNNTVITSLKGHEWGLGWNIGATFEPDENNRFGLSYRSKVDVDFNGDFSSDLMGKKTIPGKLKLTLPDMWEFSGYHKLTDAFALHYSFNYTFWSKFKSLEANSASNNAILFQKTENFSDAYRIALGGTYKINDQLTTRAGIAFDHRASKVEPSISIPDQNRYWLSGGATYAFTDHSSVDLGLTYLIGKSIHFTEKSPADLGSLPWRFKGKGSAWLFGINYNYTF